jgi:hypothetical protein
MNLNSTTVKWVILLCFCHVFAFGQESFFKVSLKSKNQLIGQIVKEEEKRLTLKIADSSFVTVHENDIKDVKRLNPNKFKKGLLWDENMHSQRYLFSSSAFTMDKGDFTYRNILGFYNGLEYGITNRLSISGGLNMYSVLANDYNRRIYNFAVKYGGWKLSKNMTAAVSFNYSDVRFNLYDYFNQSDKHTSLTGLVTYGNTDNHLTFGIGAYRFRGAHHKFDINFRDIFDYKTNVFGTFRLNGVLRLSNYFALVTENWIVLNNEYSDFFSVGIRFLKYRFMAELAMVHKTELDWTYYYENTYPYLGIAYRF